MTIRISANRNKNIFAFQNTPQIEPVEIDLAGRSVVVFDISYNDGSGSLIVGGQIALTGGFQDGQGGDMPVPEASISIEGPATLSGNVVSFVNGTMSGHVAIQVVNPPSWLRLDFSASTFPASGASASVSGSAGWR